MGYYCTVPQCTSLAGKTKNVKFHRFPRDATMADKWNVILKRGKPYTKYSKVCSLHFTQADYNVTTMGQWKTLSKDAVPSQNLPKLNPDGTVMVIRKTRTIKSKETSAVQAVKAEDVCLSDKPTWSDLERTPSTGPSSDNSDAAVAYRLQNLNVLANSITPTQPAVQLKPKKDAYMQTDPVENEDTLHCNSASDSENYSPTIYEKNDYIENQNIPYEETKTEEYIHNEEDKYIQNEEEKYIQNEEEKYIQNEEEKYILERKLQEQYAKTVDYDKIDLYKDEYQYQKEDNYQKDAFVEYQSTYLADPAEILKNQQHNLQMLQQYHRISENQNFFNDNHIKQEIEMNGEDLGYDGQKELSYPQDQVELFSEQRLVSDHRLVAQQPKTDYYEAQIKTEPDLPCESVMTSQSSPYYQNGTSDQAGYYEQATIFARQPGPELLIAKQNALSAQTQLWQNTTMKRPFFYTDSSHYNGAQFMHTRYEDLTRIMNQ